MEDTKQNLCLQKGHISKDVNLSKREIKLRNNTKSWLKWINGKNNKIFKQTFLHFLFKMTAKSSLLYDKKYNQWLIGYYNIHNPPKCPKSKGLILWKQFKKKTHFFLVRKICLLFILVLLHLFFKQTLRLEPTKR